MCEFSVKARKRSILNHNCCFIYFFHLFIIKLLNFVCIGNFIIHILNSNILCHSFVRLTFTALGSIYCTFNL